MAKAKVVEDSMLLYPEKLGKRGGMIAFNAVGKVYKDGVLVTKLLKTISVMNTGDHKENITKARARFSRELTPKQMMAWSRFHMYIEVIDPNAKEEVI